MKKNLLTIIILALQIVQVAMLGFILLSVMSTSSKTAAVVSDIASALELEQAGGTGGGSAPGAAVALADTESYYINGDDKLMVQLMVNPATGDGKTHYAQVEVALSINKTHEDYAAYGAPAQLDAFKERIKGAISGAIQNYTLEQVNDINLRNTEVKDAALQALHTLYEGSDFIYDLTFTSFLPS